MCGCRYLGVVCTKRFNMLKALGTESDNEDILHRSRVRDRNRETGRYSDRHICAYV